MSHHPSAAETHGAHEDARNEAARVRKLAAHEADVRRLLHDRWWRRVSPLMDTASRPSDDFEGCTE